MKASCVKESLSEMYYNIDVIVKINNGSIELRRIKYKASAVFHLANSEMLSNTSSVEI